MKCEKCGAELDDNAVFCDGCGSFVMHKEYSALPNNGYRQRQERRSRVWLVILISAVFAGIAGTGIGYGIIEKDRIEKMKQQMGNPVVEESKRGWDKSLIREFPIYEYGAADERNSAAGNADKKQ